MNVAAAKCEDFFGATLKAVVVYDDFNYAAHAVAMLEWVGCQTDRDLKWDVKPWRVDVLQQLSLTGIAQAEAVDANVIVIAMTGTRSLSDGLLQWLERWAARRTFKDAAMLLLHPAGNAESVPLANWLKSFAEARGLTFLAGHEVWPSAPPGSSPGQPRPLAVPEFPPVVDYPRIPDHWGLND